VIILLRTTIKLQRLVLGWRTAGSQAAMHRSEPFIDGMACAIGRCHRILAHAPGRDGPRRDRDRCDWPTRIRGMCPQQCGGDGALDGELRPRQTEVGREPIAVVFDAPTGGLFTADARSDSITVLDTRSGRPERQVPVGAYPAGLGYHRGLRGCTPVTRPRERSRPSARMSCSRLGPCPLGLGPAASPWTKCGATPTARISWPAPSRSSTPPRSARSAASGCARVRAKLSSTR
jgi:YVTN family beta-propeller protein